MMQNITEFHKYDKLCKTIQIGGEKKMKNVSEYRITITLNEEEYNKLKYATEYLKKYNTDNASISKLSSKLMSILIKALDERIEEKTALLSTIDKESKEKNIKAILENIQNDHIDSPKIIENLAFLSNVKKAIEKMEEDNTETINTKTIKETKNKDKENENKKEIEKETKKAEDKTIEEKQQKETQAKREEKIETKVENKENKIDDEEEIIRFPDL
jgi:hypothetical protein